jgi:hypothetical protein
MIAVLGTSVIGFVVDRVFLDPGMPGPARASASSPAPRPAAPAGAAPAAAPHASAAPTAAAPAATAKPALSQAASAGAARVPLAERLKALTLPDGEPTAIREAFAPSAAWLASLEEGRPGPGPQPDSAADFVRAHKLTSVLRRSQVGSAVIDGKVVVIGECLDGYRLIALAADSAIFRSPQGAKEVRLSIIGPGSRP